MSIYTKLSIEDKREICRLTGTDMQTLYRLLTGKGYPRNADYLIANIKAYSQVFKSSANDNRI